MHFSLETLALQIANVLVLIWLLNRYVLGPLGARLVERRTVLALADQALKDEQARSNQLAQSLDQALAQVAQLNSTAMAQAQAQLAQERLSVIQAAQVEADSLIKRAGIQASEVERQIHAAAEQESIDAAIAMASALLGELPDQVLDDAYRLQFEQWLAQGQLPDGPLVLHLANGAHIEQWRTLVPGAQILIDPALIAGAQLISGNRQIGFSLHTRLDAIREALANG
jgi:F0F1-type ATP synthase membrane subunit b/b'